MKRVLQAIVVALAAGWLVACATDGTSRPVEDGDGAARDDGARASGLADDEGVQAQALDGGEPGPSSQAGELLSQRRIYFAFDSSTVQDQYLDMVRAHVRYLLDHPELSIRLEGHADERGSREYNIGLGDRRAGAVKQLLQSEGVASGRIETVSYGEEKPAVQGHNEEAWAKNRRVRIVYER